MGIEKTWAMVTDIRVLAAGTCFHLWFLSSLAFGFLIVGILIIGAVNRPASGIPIISSFPLLAFSWKDGGDPLPWNLNPSYLVHGAGQKNLHCTGLD